MEEGRSDFKILIGKPTGKRHLCLIDGRTILLCFLKKWVSIREIGLIQLRIEIIGESRHNYT